MEPENKFPSTQKYTIGPCPDSDELIPHPEALFDNHFNIILPRANWDLNHRPDDGCSKDL
jgi:hypothetical protein